MGQFSLSFLFFLTLCLSIHCFQNPSQNPLQASPIKVKPTQAFPHLKFHRPVDLQDPRDGKNYLYLVEQKGRIYAFQNSKETKRKILFLDIRHKVRTRHGEEGLLGLAFHPKYKENGYFFVNYTASHPRRTVISRFQRQKNQPFRADPKSEKVILEIPQPWGNHNGGCIAFGPDGMLYIGMGDGGSGGDPLNHGQRLDTLLGKILRIHVDSTEEDKNYAIPKDNPFVHQPGARPEIWAYGLRNPWRFYIPPHGKWIWVADVGQNRIEEVSLVKKGGNYGWNLKEGNLLFRRKKIPKKVKLEDPLWQYDHSQGISITGGVICQDPDLPMLKGAYLCADFYFGRIWALWITQDRKLDKVLEIHKSEINISSFGIDSRHRLYLLDYYRGKILRLKSIKNIK